MTQTQIKSLLRLSRKEKIEIAQTLWENIASEKTDDYISEDHKEKLEKTLKNIASGKTGLKKWSEVRKKFLGK